MTDKLDADRSVLGPRIRVIAAGLPRCATSSLQAALESKHLGYDPCMHMAHVLPHPARSRLILEAMREEHDTQRRRELLHRVFDGYEATTDFPGCYFVEDLMDMYPDAVIVLNQRRDGNAGWLKSVRDSLGLYATLKYYAICFLYESDRIHYRIHQELTERWARRCGAETLADLYDAYQEFVLREAKKRGRQVVVWQPQHGWEPLCKILGKQVPEDEPFPWVNDAATMKVLKRVFLSRGLLSWAALVGGAYAAWTCAPGVFALASARLAKVFL
jgi:hypothetical protein